MSRRLRTQPCDDKLTEQNKLSEIFLENEDLIRSVIFTKVFDRQQAEDIFQDFFLSFITSPPKNHENISSYIKTRLTRDIIDHSRKNQRYRNMIDKYSKHPSRDDTDHKSSDFDAIIEEEQEKVLKVLSDNLTKSEAKAIELRHLNGYNTDEASEIMNVKKRSTSRYLAVGIKKLREIFGSDLADDNI